MEWISPLATLLVGGGIFTQLWGMRKELSCLKGEFSTFRQFVSKQLEDHEQRLRAQEKQDD